MKAFLPPLSCLICGIIITFNLNAQDQHKIDSLLLELSVTEPDTNRARVLFTLTWENMKSRSTTIARKYADSAMILCQALGYEKGIALVNYYYGVMGRLEGDYETALKHFEIYNLFHAKNGDSIKLAHSFYQIASIYKRQGNYQKSLETYLRILKIYESINQSYSIATTLNSIGIIYKNLNQDKEALEHYHKALDIFKELDAKIDMADCLSNIGNIHAINEEYETALNFYQKAQDLNQILENRWGIAYQLSNMGIVYGHLKRYPEAIANHQESLEIRLDLGQKNEIAQSYGNLGETYLKMKRYAQARDYLQKSISISRSIGIMPELQRAFFNLSDVFAQEAQFRKAYDYYKLYTNLKDSLFNESNTKQINELQAKYEYERKEKEIALMTREQEAQKAELLREKNLKTIFVSGILLLCMLIIFLITYFRQKLKNKEILANKNEEINLRKIKEMEKNQKLFALDAMINGQEAERKRIAQDLHDGLGVLLSNVQMQFAAMREEINKIMKLDMYQSTNQLLNEASAEVRKIAHNMMPGTLLKLGLVPAIKDICDNINKTTEINVEFHAFDLEERLNEQTEVSVYRLIQEALNNVVKHAYAKEVLVQLSKSENSMNITIEDDGIGFNVAQVRKKGGMGLRNLESRIKYLNGELQIISRENKGTELIIDIPLKKVVLETNQL
ncbi:MAG: tetratricopeptide repeat protein [Leptolyngbya sp. SIO1D8]|nr:tetratricopeptide repeat protein [Leptolyngbya sp. SIO1D8]